MNTHLLTRVRRHFSSDLVPPSINRHNMRAWCKSVRRLGDRWLLAQPIRSHAGAR